MADDRDAQSSSGYRLDDEQIADALRQVQLSVPIVSELFIQEVIERMLCCILDQGDWPEHTKLQARFHAKLIEEAVKEARSAPNQSLLVSALWAALSLGATSSPSLPADYIQRIRAEERSAIARTGGKAPRREPPWLAPAKELALTAYANDPTRSNEKLVAEILSCWRLDPDKCPSVRTLTRFVAKLRASGELPPRTGP
jgi:hypothetical protein